MPVLSKMISFSALSMLLVCALVLVACEKKEAPKPAEGVSFEQLGKEADKAVAKAATKLNESKEEAAARLATSLDELDAQYKDLKKKATDAKGDAKVELDKALVELV